MPQSYNPKIAVTTLVWANPRSLATTYGITFVFSSSAYLDVSVQRVCPPNGVLCLQHSGLPHSEIFGSICMCQSPKLIAAYHVLLRLWEPQASPVRPYFAYCTFKLTTFIVSYCAFYFLFVSYRNMSMNFYQRLAGYTVRRLSNNQINK